MKIAAVLLLAFVTSASTASHQTKLKEKHRLQFANLLTYYTDFADLKPLLINYGDKSIYLSSFHPQAAARLVRFNDESTEWEYGEWTRSCGSVANVTKPIEVFPGTGFEPRILWGYSMDNWDKPTAFVTLKEQKRRLTGRYKLSLQYSEEPWMLGHTPKVKYTVESQEFIVDP